MFMLTLFRAFRICFYDFAQWCQFNLVTMKIFRSYYHNFATLMFSYRKHDNFTLMLPETGLTGFQTRKVATKFEVTNL